MELYDVVIIGGGSAGLSAALYLARAKYRVLVVEKDSFGGQIAITDEVVNYPGVERISGKKLTETMRLQAESFGAEFLTAEATGLELSGQTKTVHTARGDVACHGVLYATGAHPRNVGFIGEEQYKGQGVAYCATCDGEFFTGKEIFVVGGGYAAAEESVFLTKFARHVTVLIRKGDFSCAAAVSEKAKNHEKITVLPHTVLEEVRGENGLNYARYRNVETGQVQEYRSPAGESFGVFVFAGYEPATEMLRGLVELDAHGYVRTDETGKTNVDGVYAAGDIRIKPLRQVVTAVADGALSATELEKYVSKAQEKTGLYPQRPVRPEREKQPSAPAGEESPFSKQTRQELAGVFSRMEGKLLLKLGLDDRPESKELQQWTQALCTLTDKLSSQEEPSATDVPCVSVCRPDGSFTGLAFHGVPGGHEFSGFILGLYNAAGPGQPLEDSLRREIEALPDADIQILVTLSCTMCPETVIAAQQIAAIHPGITAQIYDARLFAEMAGRYQVMSVPCMVINGKAVSFGKQKIRQIMERIRQAPPK